MHLRQKIALKYNLIIASRKGRYLEFLKDLPYPDPEKEKIVKDAIATFERDDRIMWYLRKTRAADLLELASHPEEHFDQYERQVGKEGVQKLKAGKQQALKRLEKIINAPIDSPKWKERAAVIEAEGKKLAEIITNVRHYIQNAKTHDLKLVLDYNFPPDATADKLYVELKALEDKEMSKRPDERLMKLQSEGERNFLEFADGWRWVFINKKTCNKEAKSMRHCGNSAGRSGDKILSLREPVTVETGDGRRKKKENYSKPHLTFIINDGVLGEMKGFANEHPKKNLHKYILALLEDDRVDGIRGGGYAAAKNFKLKDLTPAQRKALLKKKGKDFDQEHTDYPDEEE